MGLFWLVLCGGLVPSFRGQEGVLAVRRPSPSLPPKLSARLLKARTTTRLWLVVEVRPALVRRRAQLYGVMTIFGSGWIN